VISSDDFVIRPATRADIPEILRQRRGMYMDMGHTDAAGLDAMVASCEPYMDRAMAEGAIHAWLAVTNEHRAAGGGIVTVSPRLSRPYFPECREASILNVYVYPEYRRRGIARRLMEVMITWCRDEGFPNVSLHASKDGRPLYESLGFEPTSELKLRLR
jgi:GNAT superfamily N-acetyltransferase